MPVYALRLTRNAEVKEYIIIVLYRLTDCNETNMIKTPLHLHMVLLVTECNLTELNVDQTEKVNPSLKVRHAEDGCVELKDADITANQQTVLFFLYVMRVCCMF